jgi:hypothetical protein
MDCRETWYIQTAEEENFCRLHVNICYAKRKEGG